MAAAHVMCMIALPAQNNISHQPSGSPFGDSRPRFVSQGAPQQDHRRRAPRRRTGHHWTLRGWCASHE
eukprot:184522-Prymnesium_polylepis.1